jgi:uncharacterized membrane protein
MNLAHLHLLLNHIPTIGTVIGLGLLLVALAGKNDDLKRVSLGMFFVIALLSLPVYMTGNAAEAVIKGRPGVSEALMETHRDSALPALVFMEITGLAAWLALWQFRRLSRPARWTLPAVLLLSIVTLGLMAIAADIGGEIRHPEIGSGEETVGSGWIKSASIASFVVGRPWVWPASETLHFIGLALLLGIVLLVNLRMLGIAKSVSFEVLHRLLPLGVLGFGINAITGMLFFIAAPEQYTKNVAFYWKIVLMMLAGVNILYLTVFDEPWALGPGDEAPLTAKVVAASAIFLWVGVMYCGRMLPFIGNSF